MISKIYKGNFIYLGIRGSVLARDLIFMIVRLFIIRIKFYLLEGSVFNLFTYIYYTQYIVCMYTVQIY